MDTSLLRERLIEGNRAYQRTLDRALLTDTAVNGQHPYAVVVCCSDSRVIPEQIFQAGLGELFVVRVAGNVLGDRQLGSIEYAAEHLHCGQVIVLGHTGCGAVAAALSGGGEGFVKSITDEILAAIGCDTDPDAAGRLNVLSAVSRLKAEFAACPALADTAVDGAVYDIRTGEVHWL